MRRKRKTRCLTMDNAPMSGTWILDFVFHEFLSLSFVLSIGLQYLLAWFNDRLPNILDNPEDLL
ncbi:hypothetical protein EJ08DRAFT_52979 [Tothia fuscella]|uniref:Uncharacterized protein n=1 Tax=Tothia fuscella TaxID=1048955 RepID=A0A9P4NF38_9PEZI|nr:hypothetical protein EJ08DRAFT_52979 [Tothia fuscella]